MKRCVVGVLSVSAVVLLATVAFAQMGWGPMGPGMMGPGAGWGQQGQEGWGPGMGPGPGWGRQGQEGWGPGMGPGPGWRHPGPGRWGPGMMGPGWSGGDQGGYPCQQWSGAESAPAQITDEKAKEIAQQYADKYLAGYTVDKVLPFTGMRGVTMYSVELKGPKDELRMLHVNPWGNVMPFGGPWRRSG